VTPSTHYYVLSLGEKTITLFEAFRDSLIEVENQGFPVVSPSPASGALNDRQLGELMRTVDESFGHYYTLDPLRVVVVGEKYMQSVFNSVMKHRAAVIGRVEGDHTATSPRDLGQIVWPEVRRVMSGVLDDAMGNLIRADPGDVASGIEAVVRLVSKRVRATLVVEDGYHVRGRIGGTSESPVICPDLDVRAVVDDVIDAVIKRVLECGGRVVFTPSGSLVDWKQIVVLLHRTESVREPRGVL
jgi:hypothetical protein